MGLFAGQNAKRPPEGGLSITILGGMVQLERAKRFELSTLTLARLCSTPELRPHSVGEALNRVSRPAPQEGKQPDDEISCEIIIAGRNAKRPP